MVAADRIKLTFYTLVYSTAHPARLWGLNSISFYCGCSKPELHGMSADYEPAMETVSPYCILTNCYSHNLQQTTILEYKHFLYHH